MSASSVNVLLATVNGDSMLAVRHHNGSGVYVNLTEVYVIRKEKFLGRFRNQDVPSLEVEWESGKHSDPMKDSELPIYKKARMVLLNAARSLWGT